MQEKDNLPPIEIPIDSLNQELLEGIIKDFILREGTDYGTIEYTLEDKINQVKKLISNKKAAIYFDPNTETCTIIAS